jgi:membrane-bound serine protease (ClpP class)
VPKAPRVADAKPTLGQAQIPGCHLLGRGRFEALLSRIVGSSFGLAAAPLLFVRSVMALIGILLFAGAVLLLLETVLPGLVAGLAGLVCLGTAIVLGYTRFNLPTGHYILFSTIAGLVIGFGIWVNVFPESSAAKVFVSKRQIGNVGAEQPELLHATGSSLTPLRPSGTAMINGKRVDVVADGDFIQKGEPVKVVAIEGMRVVVRAQPVPSSTT